MRSRCFKRETMKKERRLSEETRDTLRLKALAMREKKINFSLSIKKQF